MPRVAPSQLVALIEQMYPWTPTPDTEDDELPSRLSGRCPAGGYSGDFGQGPGELMQLDPADMCRSLSPHSPQFLLDHCFWDSRQIKGFIEVGSQLTYKPG